MKTVLLNCCVIPLLKCIFDNDVEHRAHHLAHHTYATRADGQELVFQGKSSRLGELRYKNMCKEENSFKCFKSQIISDNVMWRHHSSVDIICINDYSMDNGMLLSNVFTHVERHTSFGGIESYSCSCAIFRMASSHRAVASVS